MQISMATSKAVPGCGRGGGGSAPAGTAGGRGPYPESSVCALPPPDTPQRDAQPPRAQEVKGPHEKGASVSPPAPLPAYPLPLEPIHS